MYWIEVAREAAAEAKKVRGEKCELMIRVEPAARLTPSPSCAAEVW